MNQMCCDDGGGGIGTTITRIRKDEFVINVDSSRDRKLTHFL